MPFFTFRKNGAEQQAPSVAPESHDVLRKRARHRLIGTSMLVLVGVIGFPLLFDTQPRPIAVDIPIEIPDKAKVEPLAPAAPVAPIAPTLPVASEAPLAKPVFQDQNPTVASVAPPVEPVARETPLASPTVKPAEKAPVKTNDAARAQNLLEGKPAESPVADSTTRYTVQIGAFADVLKAREVRVKLERAGIKTYTQVVTGTEGRRIRVRVGPMQGKEAANTMAEKIRKLDLPAAVLEL